MTIVQRAETARFADGLKVSRPSGYDVVILLSTYNGARFLQEQLASFEFQIGVRWQLVWRDDGSTDSTPEIMHAFAARHMPEQVVCAQDSGTNLGIFGSFLALLDAAPDAEAVAFADQDDVWLPGKLQRALARVRAIDPDRPVLYCGRQTYVDEALRPIGVSAAPRLSPGFPGLLLQNIGTGCTMVMNRAAARAVGASPKPAMSYHDWWSCLFVAAIGGEVVFDDTPAILYRQHTTNAIGASASALRRLAGVLKRGLQGYNAQFSAHLEALLRAEGELTPQVMRTVRQVEAAYAGNWIARLGLLRIPGFSRQTRIETLLLSLYLLLGNAGFAQRAPVMEVRCVREPVTVPHYRRLAILAVSATRLTGNVRRIIDTLAACGYATAVANTTKFAADAEFPEGVGFALEVGAVGGVGGNYIRALRFVQSKAALTANARILFLDESFCGVPRCEALVHAFAQTGAVWSEAVDEVDASNRCLQLAARIIDGEAFRRWSGSLIAYRGRSDLAGEGLAKLSACLAAAGYLPDILSGGAAAASVYPNETAADHRAIGLSTHRTD